MSNKEATAIEQARRSVESTQRRDLVATTLRNSAHARLSVATCGLMANAVHASAIKPLELERDRLREALTCDGNSVSVYTLLDWCADRFWLVANGETDKLGDREGQEAVIAMLRSKGRQARAALSGEEGEGNGG
jgi:hypothetical protein